MAAYEFFEHQCYINCSVPRIKTKEGKTRQIDVPWARKQSGFTLLFEAIAISLIENEIPVNKVARLLGEHPNRVWRIFKPAHDPPAFISGIMEHFPKADITFDRFHAINLLNNVIDTVRKQERKEH
jgi:transposase